MRSITFISAVLIVSADPARLARFYREALGIDLKEERHGDTELHFGCELGDVHFAIHPALSFGTAVRGQGPIRLALATPDLPSLLERLERMDVLPAYPPRDTGFAIMTEIADPDGNMVEITQLSPGWMDHLRRSRSADDPLAT